MAWLFADVPVAEVALAEDGKPLLVGSHALESPQIARWDTDGSLAAGSEIAATGWPSRFAYDRRTGKRTKPNASGTTHYYAVQLAAAVQEVDCLFLFDTNFDTVGPVTVEAQIADNSAFSTNLRTIRTFSNLSAKRTGSVALFHTGAVPIRYTHDGTAFFRLVITSAGAITPEIGEIWLGRRRQLKHRGNEPYAGVYNHMETVSRVAETVAGMESASLGIVGRHLLEARVSPSETTHQNDLRTWFRECRYGGRAFVWVEDPNEIAVQTYVARLDRPTFYFPLINGPYEREYTIQAHEQGPDYLDPEVI